MVCSFRPGIPWNVRNDGSSQVGKSSDVLSYLFVNKVSKISGYVSSYLVLIVIQLQNYKNKKQI